MSVFARLLPVLLATSALAHMQLKYPPPLRSKYNPFVPEPQYDYSMTSPLVASGTFPCKGYIGNSPMDSVATFAAGSTVNYTLEGTAVHNGGSCQIALSYDQGKTWSTIHSIMGGCVVDSLTENVQIPREAPSGTALFAWNWFNHQGNREMYENCAVVTITNGGSGLSNAADFPAPFVANAGVNQCATIEGIDVVFPYPGKNIKYGGTYATTKPTTPAGFTGSNCVPPGQTERGGGASGGGNTATSSTSCSAATSSLSSAVLPPASSQTTSTASAVTTTTSLATSVTSSATATSTKTKNCKRKRSAPTVAPSPRQLTHDDFAKHRRSHERLVRRRVMPRSGRVAAGKAEHISH